MNRVSLGRVLLGGPPAKTESPSFRRQFADRVGRHGRSGGRPAKGPTRVYFAGRFARRSELAAAAEELAAAGMQIASSWLFVDASLPDKTLDPAGRAGQVAKMDFADVTSADVCVAFTEPPDGPRGRGGRHIELGIALAQGQRIILVGPREHVFHCLPNVEQYDCWISARDALIGNLDAMRERNANPLAALRPA